MTVEALAAEILAAPPLDVFREWAQAIAEPARSLVLDEIEAAEPEDRIPLWAILVGGAPLP